MSFNKARLCCCNVTPAGEFFVELFPKIPITSGEEAQAQTYSYWVKFETSPTGSTVLYDYSAGVTNSNTTSDVTYEDLIGDGTKQNPGLGSEVVFKFSEFGPLGTFPYYRIIDNEGTEHRLFNSTALVRRGFYIDSSSRQLTQTEFDALTEVRTLFSLIQPTTRELATAWHLDGYLYVSGKFDDSAPVHQFTKGAATYEINPKLAANLPDRIGGQREVSGVESYTEFWDFTDAWPDTLTLTWTMASKFLGAGQEFVNPILGCRHFGNYQLRNLSVSGSTTYDKVTSFDITTGISTTNYNVDPDNDAEFLATETFEEDDCYNPGFPPPDPNTTNRTTFNFKNQRPGVAFSYSVNNSQNIISQRGNPRISRLGWRYAGVATWNFEANRYACDSCDPTSERLDLSATCTPANTPSNGARKNFYQRLTSDLPNQPNTLGIDLGQNSPDLPEFNGGGGFPSFPEAGFHAFGMEPALTWGEAGATFVWGLDYGHAQAATFITGATRPNVLGACGDDTLGPPHAGLTDFYAAAVELCTTPACDTTQTVNNWVGQTTMLDSVS